MEQRTSKTALSHIGIAVIFAILTAVLTDASILIFPNIGWHFLTVYFSLIGVAQITFYYLTTYTNIWFTVLSFILNFILWVAEQVNLESFFHDTFFYQDKNFRYAVIILGGLLWAGNKLIIDRLFVIFKVSLSLTNKADKIWMRGHN